MEDAEITIEHKCNTSQHLLGNKIRQLFGNKKERGTNTYYDMGETWKRDATREKSDTKVIYVRFHLVCDTSRQASPQRQGVD